MPVMVMGGAPKERAGEEQLAWQRLGATDVPLLDLESSAFNDGGIIPVRYSADGAGISPPLAWGDAPSGTRSLALIVEDPDAPTPLPFVHWIAYRILPEARGMAEGIPARDADSIFQGKNSMLKAGYTPCAPPRGDRPHRYHFQLFALDAEPELEAGAGRGKFLQALRGHVIGFGELIGTYARPGR